MCRFIKIKITIHMPVVSPFRPERSQEFLYGNSPPELMYAEVKIFGKKLLKS